MRTLRLREAAREEIDEIAHQYVAVSSIVAQRFVSALADSLRTIQRHPEAVRLRADGTRRHLVAPFPYHVVFRIYERSIVVLAVIHVRRHPEGWGQLRG